MSVLMPCIVAVNVMAADKYTVSINTNGLRNVELADKSSAFLLEPGPHWLGNFPFSIIIGNEPKGSGEWIFVRECSWSLSPNHPKVPPSAEEADVNPKTGDSTTVTLNGYDEWGKMYTLTATVQWTEVNKDTKIQRPGSTPIVATCSIKLLAVRPEATFFVDQPEPGLSLIHI